MHLGACALALHLLAAAAAPVWTRGTYSLLEVAADGSLSLSVGLPGDPASLAFAAPAPSPAPASYATRSGAGPLGQYDELALLDAAGELLYSAAYHAAADAFTFSRAPSASPAFPWFSAASPAASAASVIFYREGYMLPGGRYPTLAACAAGSAAAVAPPTCANLTGAWCCEPVELRQDGAALASTAAWGTGSGSVSGLNINMTFSNVGAQTGALSSDCNSIHWTPAGSTWSRSSAPPRRATDGPLFVFDSAPPGAGQARAALAFAPLDNFTVQSAACSGEAGFGAATAPGGASPPPGAGALRSILVARPGLKRATVAWGALMRRVYSTSRRRASGSRALSYWSDNEAGYSFWSVPRDLGKWGQPEAIFRALRSAYARAGIPIVQWEIDSNMIMGSAPPDIAWCGGWCWHSWREWNATLFPSGGNLSALLGGAPLALYVSAFCTDTVHKAEGFEFVDVNVGQRMPAAIVHPRDARRFYDSILAPAVAHWGMAHFFTDFLCYRGPQLAAALPAVYAPDAAWLEGMTGAASDLGLEVQYCMACAHQALQSLAWPAVTNARANGDGGMDLPALIFSSVMAASVGLGWSKDNLRLRVFSQGDSELQTLLAALSLGPVGLSDELVGYPTPLQPGASPDVLTNATLALSTCTANGTLLQPSFPLTPLEEVLAGDGAMGPAGGHAWATFTAVAGARGAWYVALGYSVAGNGSGALALRPRHLAPLVDWGGSGPTSPPDFGDVPSGSYLGAAGAFPPGLQYVAWDPGFPSGPQAGAAAAVFSDAAPAALPLALHAPAVLNLAPVLAGGIALLGEEGKAAAVSSYRFAGVSEDGGAGGLAVALRGAPHEALTLLWASAPAFLVQRTRVALDGQGLGSVQLPPAPAHAGQGQAAGAA
jgi:hypothetical protein